MIEPAAEKELLPNGLGTTSTGQPNCSSTFHIRSDEQRDASRKEALDLHGDGFVTWNPALLFPQFRRAGVSNIRPLERDYLQNAYLE